MNTFISLEELQIARPCRADWDKMTGDQQARFCGSCHKNVYDISQMTREDAHNLIQQKEGKVCVRLHRRSDGTVITSDCPVGISSAPRPLWWGVAALMALVGAGLSGCSAATTGTPLQGDVQMAAPAVKTPQAASHKAEPIAAPDVPAHGQPMTSVTLGRIFVPQSPLKTAATPQPQPTATPPTDAPMLMGEITMGAPPAPETKGESAPICPQPK